MEFFYEHEADGIYTRHVREEHADGSGYRMHIHERCELYYFIDGKADYLVEGAQYHMKRGSLLVMSPGEVHRTKLLADGVYERYAVNFPIDMFDQIDPERRLMCLYTERALGQMNLYEKPGYEELFERLCSEFEDDYDRKLTAYRLIMEILSGLESDYDEACEAGTNRKSRKKSSLSEKILKYVNNHISDDLSIPLLADKFYVSSSQIGRIFKQSAGASPWEYITAKRLITARKMLEEGKTAGEACEKCGFGDYSSFYRAYVKRYGESPRGKQG
ncbi:MAG: AraC family transcriptional regulator [Lachnospiraceae bacterium]|nr:AraC family transcriptional regulator [Lachnospiraceae bacterium]